MRRLFLSAVLIAVVGPSFAQSLQTPPNPRLQKEIQEKQQDIRERNLAIEERVRREQRDADYRLRQDQERMRRENMPDDNRGVVFGNERDPRYNNSNGYGSGGSDPYRSPGNTDGGRIPMPNNTRAPIWAEPLIPGMDRGRIIQRGQYDTQPDRSCQLQTWQGSDNQSFRRWVCS